MVHFAAGILPLTWRHPGAPGPPRPLFLVGKDVRGGWSDFGGKCERADKNDPLNTAVREFYEETYGAVVDARALRQRLCPANCLTLRSKTQNGHPYYMYVVELPWMPHARNAFAKALAFLRHRDLHKAYVEKVDVQWVTLDQLRDIPKRPVFEATIDAHAELLDRAVDPASDWTALCASAAADFRDA